MDPSRAHRDAIALMLSRSIPYRVHVDEVLVPDGDLDPPYVVLRSSPARRPTVTMAGYGGEVRTEHTLLVVGRDADECLAAADRVSAVLHRRRPDVPGRRTSLLTPPPGFSPPKPVPDNSVRVAGRPVVQTVLIYLLNSSPKER